MERCDGNKRAREVVSQDKKLIRGSKRHHIRARAMNGLRDLEFQMTTAISSRPSRLKPIPDYHPLISFAPFLSRQPSPSM